MAYRSYGATRISATYDFGLNGGAIGVIALGAFVSARTMIRVGNITYLKEMAGVGAFFVLTIQAGVLGATIAAPVPVNTSTLIIGQRFITERSSLNLEIFGAPLTGGQFIVDLEVSEPYENPSE